MSKRRIQDNNTLACLKKPTQPDVLVEKYRKHCHSFLELEVGSAVWRGLTPCFNILLDETSSAVSRELAEVVADDTHNVTEGLVEEGLVEPLLEKFHEFSHEFAKEFSKRIIESQGKPKAKCLRANMKPISTKDKLAKPQESEGVENIAWDRVTT
jgi:hypothetical protein